MLTRFSYTALSSNLLFDGNAVTHYSRSRGAWRWWGRAYSTTHSGARTRASSHLVYLRSRRSLYRRPRSRHSPCRSYSRFRCCRLRGRRRITRSAAPRWGRKWRSRRYSSHASRQRRCNRGQATHWTHSHRATVRDRSAGSWRARLSYSRRCITRGSRFHWCITALNCRGYSPA